MNAVGKRTAASEPLTEHDVAERIDKSVLRTLKLLQESRELGLKNDVLGSRYRASGLFEMLSAELEQWKDSDG